ncbi:MAG: hypothetical protein IJ817_00415 [Clostridia bacterium]|nr:hypothetical protein [Clostridia bacterium]
MGKEYVTRKNPEIKAIIKSDFRHLKTLYREKNSVLEVQLGSGKSLISVLADNHLYYQHLRTLQRYTLSILNNITVSKSFDTKNGYYIEQYSIKRSSSFARLKKVYQEAIISSIVDNMENYKNKSTEFLPIFLKYIMDQRNIMADSQPMLTKQEIIAGGDMADVHPMVTRNYAEKLYDFVKGTSITKHGDFNTGINLTIKVPIAQLSKLPRTELSMFGTVLNMAYKQKISCLHEEDSRAQRLVAQAVEKALDPTTVSKYRFETSQLHKEGK